MMVIAVENAPSRLRGRLALWLAEVRAGVYVGVYSARTRERIWRETCLMIGDGSACIIWDTPTDSGYSFAAVGANRRMPVDFDGMTLVKFALSAEIGHSAETAEQEKKSEGHGLVDFAESRNSDANQ
jgi:CRISPR-associated protein Cas2